MKNKRAGFTLVELIVVIAILGILAGIAIPVYSGYINKANQAADNTLLAAVNTAFAAACTENQTTPSNSSDIELTVAKDKITGITLTTLDANPVISALMSSFDTYFGSNKNTELKFYDEFGYENGAFYGMKDGVSYKNEVGTSASTNQTFEYNGKTYTYSQTDLDTFMQSSYYQAEIGELTGTVDMLSGALSDSKSGLAALVNNSSAFKSMLIDLGVIEEGQTINNSMSNDLADKIANASVLYVAQSARTLNSQTIYDAIKNGGDIGSLLTSQGFEAGINTAFVNTAMKFAVATAFVNSEYGEAYKDLYDSTKGNVTGLRTAADFYTRFSALDEFQDYLNEGPAQSDIAGFLAALSVINENAGNFDMSGNYANYNEVLNSILHPAP